MDSNWNWVIIFSKVEGQAYNHATLLKRDSGRDAFCESCNFFQNSFFRIEQLQVTVAIFSQAAKNRDQCRSFLSEAVTRGNLSTNKAVVKNVTIFRGKHRRQNLFSKVAVLLKRDYNIGVFKPATLLKMRRLQHRCFPLNMMKFLRTTVLKNISISVCLCSLNVPKFIKTVTIFLVHL